MIARYLQEILSDGIFPVSFILLLLAVLFFRKPCKKELNKMLMIDRISSFHPDPLIQADCTTECSELKQPNENTHGCLNLAKINFFNFLSNDALKNSAEKCIRKYGVGSCGPRGFYGTIDIHLNLESRLAQFMNMEETVLYSYGFSTIASAIGAYCKKSDVIFCDEKVNFSIKQGLLAARSKTIYFKHNDMEDLEIKLQTQKALEDKKKKVSSKFLIVEGIYEATGTVCNLPNLMELRNHYQLRIFIDESLSFGVLGKNGRGVTEHFYIDRSDVDMIMGSLEWSIGSIGGFCIGSSAVIEHQRLSGLGYCFSASLPPFLCEIAICALDIFENDPSVFENLKNLCKTLHNELETIDQFDVISNPISPLKVFTVKNPTDKEKIVNLIHSHCAKENIHLIVSEDTIRFNASVTMSNPDIAKVVATLKEAANYYC